MSGKASTLTGPRRRRRPPGSPRRPGVRARRARRPRPSRRRAGERSCRPGRGCPEVVLGSRGEREGEVQGAGRLGGGRDPLDRAVQVVDEPIRIPVLDRGPDRPRARDAGDRECRVGGLWPVPVLQVHRYGKVGGPVERAGMLDHLVETGLAIRPAEGCGEAAAGAGQRLEAEFGQRHGRARVPRVRDHEGLALVEGAKGFSLRELGHGLASTEPDRDVAPT